MPVGNATTRVAEIQHMIAVLQPPPSPQPTQADFAGQLSAARQAESPASLQPAAATPSATSAGGSGEAKFGPAIDAAASRNGIDPSLLRALIKQESGFDPNARSPAGAVGLTQLMPGTAASLGVRNPADPTQSIEGGARYLRQQLDRFGGDTAKALAAYNAGPGAVERYGGVPPYAETRNYVRRVLAYAQQYRSGLAA